MSDSLQSHGFLQAMEFSRPKYRKEYSLSFLQVIFPTQGSNPGLLHCRQILYHQRYFILHVLKHYSEKGFIELPKVFLVKNMLRTLL